jgi:hypothetical protein
VIAGTLQVPGDSLLSLTAATIRVEGRCSRATASARPTRSGGGRRHRRAGRHPDARFGDLTLDAGGASTSRGRDGQRGPGDEIRHARGDGAITIGRTLRNEADRRPRRHRRHRVEAIIALLGYSIEVSSSGGTVLLDDRLIATGRPAATSRSPPRAT